MPGVYGIASITNATTVVLDSSAVDTTPAGAASVSYRVIDGGNALCLAYLYDGEESGLIEWNSPANAGSAAQTHMVGGVTYINGGITLAADVDYDLADGTIYGEKKGFILKGTLTTNDATVDLDTNGFQLNGSALAEVNAIDAAADGCFLEWNGLWHCVSKTGGATEA